MDTATTALVTAINDARLDMHAGNMSALFNELYRQAEATDPEIARSLLVLGRPYVTVEDMRDGLRSVVVNILRFA